MNSFPAARTATKLASEGFAFEAEIRLLDFGRMAYHVAYLPVVASKTLPLKRYPRLRVQGLVDDTPFSGACHPSNGQHYLLFSKSILRELGKACGDSVSISLVPTDQNEVKVPIELDLELNRRPLLKSTWNALTPGKRRGFCYRISSAKRPETREDRVHQIIDEVMNLD